LLAKRQTSCQRAAKSSHQIMHCSPLHLCNLELSNSIDWRYLKQLLT
jgi:hypothetical protein